LSSSYRPPEHKVGKGQKDEIHAQQHIKVDWQVKAISQSDTFESLIFDIEIAHFVGADFESVKRVRGGNLVWRNVGVVQHLLVSIIRVDNLGDVVVRFFLDANLEAI
jgi:hypothetical protein